MTLLDRVTATFDGDQSKALDGLRPLFMVIKLATPRSSFEKLTEAVPEAEQWSREAATKGPERTGELLALITPETLAQKIEKRGFTNDEIDKLGECVGQFLTESVDTDVAAEIANRIPFMK